jgi:hypothetical protein
MASRPARCRPSPPDATPSTRGTRNSPRILIVSQTIVNISGWTDMPGARLKPRTTCRQRSDVDQAGDSNVASLERAHRVPSSPPLSDVPGLNRENSNKSEQYIGRPLKCAGLKVNKSSRLVSGALWNTASRSAVFEFAPVASCRFEREG